MKSFIIIALAFIDLTLLINLLYSVDDKNFYENLLTAKKITIITNLNAEEPVRTGVMQCGIDLAYSVGLLGKSVEVYTIENNTCFYYYSADPSMSRLVEDRIEMCNEKMNSVPSIVIIPFVKSKMENTRLTVGISEGNPICAINIRS